RHYARSAHVGTSLWRQPVRMRRNYTARIERRARGIVVRQRRAARRGRFGFATFFAPRMLALGGIDTRTARASLCRVYCDDESDGDRSLARARHFADLVGCGRAFVRGHVHFVVADAAPRNSRVDDQQREIRVLYAESFGTPRRVWQLARLRRVGGAGQGGTRG